MVDQIKDYFPTTKKLFCEIIQQIMFPTYKKSEMVDQIKDYFPTTKKLFCEIAFFR